MSDPTHTSLPGPKVLLIGPSGTGKTFSIGTLVDWAEKNGKEVFVHFIEQGRETLMGYWTDPPPRGKGLSADKIPACLHWHESLIKPLGLRDIMDMAEKSGKLTYEMLTKSQDPKRSENNPFYKVLGDMFDFIDDRTGKHYGPVDSWGTDKIFVQDSLSELANAAVKMTIGSRPTMAPPEYGTAQNNLMNFLRLATQGIRSTYVLIGHVDRQEDQITGAQKLMVRAIGKALGGDIPQLFSDTIYTVREGDKWWWDTSISSVDTKTRSLPIASRIPPNFGQIMDIWKARGGV